MLVVLLMMATSMTFPTVTAAVSTSRTTISITIHCSVSITPPMTCDVNKTQSILLHELILWFCLMRRNGPTPTGTPVSSTYFTSWCSIVRMELLRSHHLNAWMFCSCVGFAEMRIILPGDPRNASIDSNSLIKNIRRMHSVFSTQTLSYAVSK